MQVHKLLFVLLYFLAPYSMFPQIFPLFLPEYFPWSDQTFGRCLCKPSLWGHLKSPFFEINWLRKCSHKSAIVVLAVRNISSSFWNQWDEKVVEHVSMTFGIYACPCLFWKKKGPIILCAIILPTTLLLSHNNDVFHGPIDDCWWLNPVRRKRASLDIRVFFTKFSCALERFNVCLNSSRSWKSVEFSSCSIWILDECMWRTSFKIRGVVLT